MIATWLRRYAPAEILSVLAALAGASAGWSLTSSAAAAAVAGAWTETLVYYSVMLARELIADRGRRSSLITLRNLVLEFGLGEALDSLIIRPGFIWGALELVPNFAAGVIVGKLAADLVFYIPTVTAFELRRRYLG